MSVGVDQPERMNRGGGRRSTERRCRERRAGRPSREPGGVTRRRGRRTGEGDRESMDGERTRERGM